MKSGLYFINRKGMDENVARLIEPDLEKPLNGPAMLVHEGGMTFVNIEPAIFPQLTEVCKYHTYSYDEDHRAVDACHHPNNAPSRCSWGDCRPDVCPVCRKGGAAE